MRPLMACALAALVACSEGKPGPIGPEGPQGPQGFMGAKGEPGAQGAPGAGYNVYYAEQTGTVIITDSTAYLSAYADTNLSLSLPTVASPTEVDLFALGTVSYLNASGGKAMCVFAFSLGDSPAGTYDAFVRDPAPGSGVGGNTRVVTVAAGKRVTVNPGAQHTVKVLAATDGTTGSECDLFKWRLWATIRS